jgi:hypothetical protein
MSPEIIAGILDELDKCDEKPPWMRLVHNKSFNQNASYLHMKGKFGMSYHIIIFQPGKDCLLSDDLFVEGRLKNVQENKTEVVRVTIRIPAKENYKTKFSTVIRQSREFKTPRIHE